MFVFHLLAILTLSNKLRYVFFSNLTTKIIPQGHGTFLSNLNQLSNGTHDLPKESGFLNHLHWEHTTFLDTSRHHPPPQGELIIKLSKNRFLQLYQRFIKVFFGLYLNHPWWIEVMMDHQTTIQRIFQCNTWSSQPMNIFSLGLSGRFTSDKKA